MRNFAGGTGLIETGSVGGRPGSSGDERPGRADRTREGIAMKRLVAVAVVLAVVGAVRADGPDPTGTWKWSTTVNNQTRESTLKLKLDGDKLTGTLTRGGNDTAIENATFKDGEISFTVTRDRNGQKVTTKYTGKVTEDTIKGKSEFDRNGQTQSRDWEAKRSKD
jgi:hypothetical protein